MSVAPVRSSESISVRAGAAAGRLRVEHEQRRVALRGDRQRVGVHRARRRVDDDELGGVERVEHVAEGAAAEHADGVVHRASRSG